MTGQGRLPDEFADLERFADQWAIETSEGRKQERIRSTAADREAFHAAAHPLAARGLAHLDTAPIDSWGRQERELMHILLSLAHVSLAIEKQRDQEARHAINHAHFTITRSAEAAFPR